jgi:[CysO sulfur-carrier protein]-S-L-cysteine hydrolase
VVEIILPHDVQKRIRGALAGAGHREIGGILMGECVEPGLFRVSDLTLQGHGGSFASFIRRAGESLAALTRFFRRTRREYRRFNYLGEWHSHPSFSPEPSDKDVETMLGIALDPLVGANFVALLIVHLASDAALECSATTFWPDGTFLPARLILEEPL